MESEQTIEVRAHPKTPNIALAPPPPGAGFSLDKSVIKFSKFINITFTIVAYLDNSFAINVYNLMSLKGAIMNTLEAINSRRSCKNFIPDKLVPEDIIHKICEAGTKAASGMNKQAAKIIVINNKEDRDKIVKLNAGVLGASGDTFYGAPQIICVVADKSAFTYVYDGSLVMGNMMLAAEELGIGAC